MTWLVPLPVVVPLVGAGLTLALYRSARAQRSISVLALLIVVAATVGLMMEVSGDPISVQVGGWPAPMGITLIADRVSSLMLLVSSIVTLGVLLFSLAQGHADEEEAGPLAIFHPTYLVLSAGVSIAFLTGDLFNLYVGFEVLLAASYVLITLGGTRERIRSGTIYIMVAVASSLIFLAAVALTYTATGTVSFAQLAIRLQEIDPGTATLIQTMLIVAFGIKAAIFPLAAWLPDSYPTAPAPVTAVFAGLLTKVGVYAIIRIQTLLFPSKGPSTVLLVLGIATMVVAILGALVQNDIKRLLSFTLVSHIGYMVFGLGLANETGLAAAIFYVVHHITVQTSLFLVVGLVEWKAGTTKLNQLGGLAKAAPVLAMTFFFPAMSLGGIPPLSGFLGKIGLLQAGAHVATPLAWTAVGAAVLTSLLTLYALVKAWNKAFWQPLPAQTTLRRLPAGMVAPVAGLIVGMVSLTVFAGPIYTFCQHAAANLEARVPYITEVLPDGDVAPEFEVD